jgi:1,4-dihydroxy-2-naphthoyl-CoA hydrolase
MPRQTTFKHWDQRTADGMIAANDAVTGLPAYLGIKFVDFTPGRLVATMTVRDELLTPFKTLHGGVMAGLVDHVLGCVLYPLMPRGQWAATTEFKLNYLAPIFGGVELRAESTVVSLGRRTAVVQVEVSNGDQLVCVAQGTLLVSDPAKKSGASSE